jgi:hypothetical protein
MEYLINWIAFIAAMVYDLVACFDISNTETPALRFIKSVGLIIVTALGTVNLVILLGGIQ